MRRWLDIILEVERTVDVNGIMCRGIPVWPFVRVLLHRYTAFPKISEKTLANIESARGVRVIGDAAQLDLLGRLGDVDVLFFSRCADHDKFINGRCYSSTIDPYLEKIAGRYRCLKLELATRNIESTTPRWYETIFLKHGMPEYEYPKDFRLAQKLEPVRKAFLANGFDLGLYYGVLEHDIQRSEQFYLFYRDVLSRIRPGAVAQVAYGYPGGMGLMRACHEMGIETIEIQHGVMCGQVWFEGWTQVPQGGYPVVPKRFFVWGQNFKDGIERGRQDVQEFHRAVVCGNQWMNRQGEDTDGNFGEGEFFERIRSAGRRILLTLGIEDSLPGHLVEAMKRSDPDWIWLVRAHPGHREAADMVKSQLECSGVLNFEYEESSVCSLNKLFTVADYHVTDYSNTAFDALRFGVRTIFYSDRSLQYFSDYIESGLFEFESCSTDKFLHYISRVWDKGTVRSWADGFYDPDESKCMLAFDKVMSGGHRKSIIDFDHRLVHQNRLGVAFWEQNKPRQAEECFIEALRMNPDDLQAYNQLAGLYWQCGQTEKAGMWLREAINRNPNDKQTRKSWDLFCRYSGMTERNDIDSTLMG